MFRILDRKRKVIGLLQSPIEPRIEEAINGMYELYFSVPSSYQGLELEGYIQIENEHEYVIKEIVTHGTNREVVAVMNVEELFGNSWVTFRSVDTNVYDCMREILSGTNWRAVNQSTREVTRSLLGSNTTSWDLISQFCSIYDVEVKFDTYKKEVTIVDRLGGDLGVYFMNELNLKQLNHDSHTHKYITQVIPIGKNGMTIEDINDGKLYVTDYTYTDKKITGIWKADSYNDKQALKEDAQKFLAEMAVPYQTYECLVVDLNKAQGASNFAYNIGDIITLIDNTTNQRIKQRIIKQTRYLIDPSSNTIQIANKNMTFQDYYKRLQLIANMTEQILNGDGTISTDKVEVGDVDFTLTADSVLAEHIKSNQIFARHIVADNITAEHIKSESIDTRHLKANIINAGHIQAGSITAGSGIIAEGAIGDAEISNVNANKINAGEIDTSKVRVTGKDGFLFIENNTLYVVDNNRQIRVELGSIQDATNYGFIVRGADGQTILIDHNGVKNAGLTDGAVDNRVVSENANISGKKLDINSVIRSINEDGSVKITGTVVQVGETTLDIKMSEQTNLITEQGKKLETQQSQITSNTESIKLKVDNQTYQSDKQGINSKLDKHTSEIKVLQEEISLKVGQTEIDRVKDEIVGTVDSKIEEAKSEIKVTTDGISQSVSQVTNKTQELDGKIQQHESRLSSAESKITPDAITNVVSQNFYTKGDIDKKGYQTQSQVQQTVDGLQVKVQKSGGYNLLYNGDFKNSFKHWENDGFVLYKGSSSPSGLCIYVTGEIGKTYTTKQSVNLDANQDSYTLSGYIHTTSRGEDGETNPFKAIYCIIEFTDGTKSYQSVGSTSFDVWEHRSITFNKPTGKSFSNILIYCYVRDTTKQVSFSQIMLEKGSIATEFTPNPNEIFDGIVTIDNTGVTVENSDSDTKTIMDSSSFSVEDNNGGTVAEFSRTSNIPELTAGIIRADEVYGSNLINTQQSVTYYVNLSSGSDNNDGSSTNPFKSIQKALDSLDKFLEEGAVVNINVSGTGNEVVKVQGFTGNGTLRIILQNGTKLHCNTFDVLECKCRVYVQGDDTFSNSAGQIINDDTGTCFYVRNSPYVEVRKICIVGVKKGDGYAITSGFGSNVYVNECELSRFNASVRAEYSSIIQMYACKGSDLNYIGNGTGFGKMFLQKNTGTVPNADNEFQSSSVFFTWGGGTGCTKTSGTIYKPSSTAPPPPPPATTNTRTWKFNKIYSDETLNGWPNKSELIQGYASKWDTGRWTGYMKFTDNMAGIKDTLKGATNLSGRLYIQRRTTAGNSTGSRVCLYASDGTTITTSVKLDRGKGTWISIPSAVLTKIQNGSVTYFYVKADSNNAETYIKYESNPKLEITYKK